MVCKFTNRAIGAIKLASGILKRGGVHVKHFSRFRAPIGATASSTVVEMHFH